MPTAEPVSQHSYSPDDDASTPATVTQHIITQTHQHHITGDTALSWPHQHSNHGHRGPRAQSAPVQHRHAQYAHLARTNHKHQRSFQPHLPHECCHLLALLHASPSPQPNPAPSSSLTTDLVWLGTARLGSLWPGPPQLSTAQPGNRLSGIAWHSMAQRSKSTASPGLGSAGGLAWLGTAPARPEARLSSMRRGVAWTGRLGWLGQAVRCNGQCHHAMLHT